MAGKCNNLITALGLYTAASKNYYEIHSVFGIELDSNISLEPNESFSDNSSESVHSPKDEIFSDSESSVSSSFLFVLLLTSDEYKFFFAHSENYLRRDTYELKCGLRKTMSKSYNVFEQRSWANLLHRKLEVEIRKYNIDCVFMFKRNKIYPNSKTCFAVIEAYCKQCHSKLIGKIIDDPEKHQSDDGNISIQFSCKGDFNSLHEKNTMKRPLSGKERRLLSKKLCNENIAPSQYRRMKLPKWSTEIVNPPICPDQMFLMWQNMRIERTNNRT